ncbi:MAG: glutamate--tRNA ligase [Actinomycetota bacterium]|nr:glutamate--tRNA ligase [Actinomycetota bacterium]
MDKKNKEVRVRFAPSPTGYLHIGSARTAFFNWLYAKKKAGQFILRIEDTDIARHQEETIDIILNSLKWLGLDWNEGPESGGGYGPYRQSLRLEIYKKYADKLIEEKKAYRCFCSPESLKAERENKKDREVGPGDGKAFKYDRRCFKLSQKSIEANIESGKPFAIRFMVPENEVINFRDTVYGNITINASNIEDFIIIRTNGLPTYNYSVVVDDALMKITHVIRGEDHLSNTPKQILIYRALGFDIPDFTHLPMILGQDGQKLSKRHGSISIEKYIEDGFLKEAILNYLALLGWAYDEKTTTFSIDELIEKFELDSINKKPAKFDYDKLLWVNGYYIRNMENSVLEKLLETQIKKYLASREMSDPESSPGNLQQKIARITPLVKERIKTLKESINLVSPFFIETVYSDQSKNYFKNKNIDALKILNSIYSALDEVDDRFPAKETEGNLRLVAKNLNLNLRKVAEVTRIAIWNSPVSPPLFETMEILGKELTLRRIKDYIKIIS